MVNPFRLRVRDRRQRSYRLNEKPPIERHYLSVLSSAMSIIMLVLALSLKVWAIGKNAACRIVFGLTSVTVTFLDPNSTHRSPVPYSMTGYYTEQEQIFISCVISVAVLTILSSIVAAVISTGYPRERMEFLRHFSVFNVVSLFCSVLVAGLWLAVVQRLPQGIPGIPGLSRCDMSHMPISFGYCYYIVLVAAVFSLGAATYNLLCSRTAADRRRRLRNRITREQRRQDSRSHYQRELIGITPPTYTVVENPLNHLEEETSLMEQERDSSLPVPPPYSL